VGRFVVSRIAQGVVVLFGVTLAAFALIHLAPGDPAKLILGLRATPASVAELRHELGLDKPLPDQFVDFVTHAARLDFGQSAVHRESVGSLIGGRLGASLLLIVYGSVLSVVIAVPLGVISALKRNRLADHSTRVVTMVAFAMPPFWLGLLLLLVFSVNLGWLPSSGYGEAVAGRLESLTLPAIVLALGLVPLLLRTLRSSMIEALSSEYVESARALGFRERRVVVKHALRTSLVSMVTVLGLNVAYVLGGIVVIENVFVIPGVGSLLVDAAVTRDYPVVQAIALIFAVIVVVVNITTDITYARLDPRVRL
jgi:peptide/nickel transport system permease protein